MSMEHKEKSTTAGNAAGAKPAHAPNSQDGQIVSFAGDKLVTKCSEGHEHSYTLAKDAKLTCDGTVCKTENLKAGTKVRVTTRNEDRNLATGVESLNKQSEFASCS